MGMLEDKKRGLTPEEADKSRELILNSIDPENNPDPDAPTPIPMYHPGEEPGVQSDAPSINNVQDEEIDKEEDNPFAKFKKADPEEEPAAEENPFARFKKAGPDSVINDEKEDNPFARFKKVAPVVATPIEEKEDGGILDAAVTGVKKMSKAVHVSWN